MSQAPELVMTLGRDLTIRPLASPLRQTLMGQLQFENPRYIEATRLGRWTRNIPRMLRFYEELGRDGLRIPRGYVRGAVDLCRSRGIAFRIEDRRRQLAPRQFAFNGRLKPYQKQAVDDCLSKDFGVLSAPTGSGKTVMALAAVAARRQPALIIVHTRELQHQWVARIGQFLGIRADAVGEVGAGKVRIGEDITVAMVQTLYKHSDAVASRIGFIVVDECHRCPSRTFTEAVTAFDSRFMLGLSATPYRRDKLSQLIFWHLGSLCHEIDQRRLVSSGDVLHAEVIWRHTEFSPHVDAVNEYSRMLSELTTDDRRNRLIADDVAGEVRQRPGTILVLSDRRRHCEALKALLQYRHGVVAEKLTGEMTAVERRAVLDRLGRGEVRVLVATGQLIGEGFDCRELDTLFLATPVRFSGRVLQYLGRVLRPAPGKRKARVYDYVDDRVDVLVAAARARQRVYARTKETFFER